MAQSIMVTGVVSYMETLRKIQKAFLISSIDRFISSRILNALTKLV